MAAIRLLRNVGAASGLPVFQQRVRASETLTLRCLTDGELLESTLVTDWFALNEPKRMFASYVEATRSVQSSSHLLQESF